MKNLNKLTDFDVQITGSQIAKSAVIFVHGFGVKRDSRGMFVDIEKILSTSLLSVRGDFSIVQEDKCVTLPFSHQGQRLHTITQYLQEHSGIESFTYIGHSQGCITIGIEQPENSKIILLAPPVVSPFSEFIKTSGWHNKGSHLDMNGMSCLVRSDLIIDVPPEFWAEFKLIDSECLYKKLARNNDVKIIFAGKDPILGVQKPPDNIQAYTIPDADHDFSSTSRRELLNLLKEMIVRP